jgi:hypothetical protein
MLPSAIVGRRARLQKLGFDNASIETLARHANELPNLQLLEGPINNEKRAAMPAEWLTQLLPDASAQLPSANCSSITPRLRSPAERPDRYLAAMEQCGKVRYER